MVLFKWWAKNKKKVQRGNDSSKYYHEMIDKELDYERNKSSSYENRCNILFLCLTIILPLLISNIKTGKIFEIISKMDFNTPWPEIVKGISGIVVYLSFLMALIFSIKVIKPVTNTGFSANKVGNDALNTAEEVTIHDQITYRREMLNSYIETNENKSKKINIAIISTLFCIISIVVYMNI